MPDENPSGLGNFTCNLRLPGQYFDRETNLHYNYFRDYDPSIGRYVQSDPIGLGGGLNTYAYVNGQPLRLVDPLGLRGGLGKFVDSILNQLGFPPTDPQKFGQAAGARTQAEIAGQRAGFELAIARCQAGGAPPTNDTYIEADCMQRIPAPTLTGREGVAALFACKNEYKERTKDCKASCALYPEFCVKKMGFVIETEPKPIIVCK